MVIRYLTAENLRKNTRTDQASHSSNNKAKFENTFGYVLAYTCDNHKNQENQFFVCDYEIHIHGRR